MIKIKEYIARQYGNRGVQLSLPQVFINDNNIQTGDTLEIYRDNLPDGDDVLIIKLKNNSKIINQEMEISGYAEQ